jgi:hypothetical protein
VLGLEDLAGLPIVGVNSATPIAPSRSIPTKRPSSRTPAR